jgi:hypothetical protein
MRIALVLFTFVLLLGCTSDRRLDPSLPPLELDNLPIVYDNYVEACFGLTAEQWAELARRFDPPAASPREERRRIREVIAQFEQIAGEQTPTWRDLREDEINPTGNGNIDCIGESTNTTTYLRLLEQHQLLRWHVVLGKAFRDFLHFDTHFSAQIRDETTGQRYVVDSWYLDSGHPPHIQKTEEWLWRQPWPAEENPPLSAPELVASDA